MITLRKTLLGLAAIAAVSPAAADWDVTGFVAMDSQAFWLDSQYEHQQDGANISLLVQPEFYWRSESGRQRISIVGFGRLDSQDDERSHADLREAYWGIDGDGWDFSAGVGKVYWGVAESRHLVDVINQTDLVEGLDEESKLGQPLVNFNIDRDYGRFELFALPYFRERSFPGPEGRFRAPLVVDTDNPVYESSDEEKHVDYALRYSHYFGDVDIGAHVFDGTSREARFVVAPEGDRLLPVYDQMTQYGVDLQYTADAWLWKLEAISRNTRVDDFAAAVGGFEYTFYGVNDSALDVGVLVEYLYDGRNEFSPPTVFDNDVFVGTRLAWNDADDSSLLAGAAIDLDSQETFLSIEAEKRFGDNVLAEVLLRSFVNVSAGGSLHSVKQDDYIELRLSWYY